MKINKFTIMLVAVGLCIVGAVHANSIDLTAVAVGGKVIAGDGSIWQVTDPQAAGTGVFKPFVRIQNNDVESGYNTDAKSPPLDAKAGIWTHSVLWSSLTPGPFQGSGSYYRFDLDVNQNSANPLISLNTFQIWSGNVADQSTDTLGGSGFTKLYDLANSASPGAPVLIDWAINKGGEGIADVSVFIPAALGVPLDQPYMYLFSSFGGDKTSIYAANDGPEYWGTRSSPVPLPPSLLLLAPSLAGMVLLRKRLKK